MDTGCALLHFHSIIHIYDAAWKILKARNHSEDLGVDRKIILQWASGKLTGCIWLRIGTLMNTVMKYWVP
jgi:hypothetical protein